MAAESETQHVSAPSAQSNAKFDKPFPAAESTKRKDAPDAESGAADSEPRKRQFDSNRGRGRGRGGGRGGRGRKHEFTRREAK
jgi:hypothetical protein